MLGVLGGGYPVSGGHPAVHLKLCHWCNCRVLLRIWLPNLAPTSSFPPLKSLMEKPHTLGPSFSVSRWFISFFSASFSFRFVRFCGRARSVINIRLLYSDLAHLPFPGTTRKTWGDERRVRRISDYLPPLSSHSFLPSFFPSFQKHKRKERRKKKKKKSLRGGERDQTAAFFVNDNETRREGMILGIVQVRCDCLINYKLILNRQEWIPLFVLFSFFFFFFFTARERKVDTCRLFHPGSGLGGLCIHLPTVRCRVERG